MITIVSGAQWGDEGKAKVIDYFAKDFDYVVRYQGGANAGHTVYLGEQKIVFHLVPSGILNKDARVVIGNGLVVDLDEFLKEVDMVGAYVETRGRIFLSNRAHVVMPYHKILDKAKEARSAESAIGTTQRGIGPAYADKADRLGVRVGDLFIDPAKLREKIRAGYEVKEFLLKEYYRVAERPTVDAIFNQFRSLAARIEPYVADTEHLLQEAHRQGKRILFEGAQGSLLDLDFGTYPYVTSSNTIAPGALVGGGTGVAAVDAVIGIAKAYITRVGEGPFPTEQTNEIGENLRKAGHEFGATTGRPRRCGWFDAVATRYSAGVCGISAFFLTKLDVLDGLGNLKVCTAYRKPDGSVTDRFPSTLEELETVSPVYEDLEGWSEKTFGVRRYRDLPPAATRYIEKLESLVGRKIAYISTGFSRDDVIVR